MAKSINKVELLGRVGTDPEMKYTASGIAVTQLRLATDRVRKGGESETDWHQIVVWDKLAEACANYVEKGQRLYVAGRLAQNSWTGDDGQRRYRTEIHAQEVVFLDSSSNGGGGNHTGDGYCQRGQRRRQPRGQRPETTTDSTLPVVTSPATRTLPSNWTVSNTGAFRLKRAQPRGRSLTAGAAPLPFPD